MTKTKDLSDWWQVDTFVASDRTTGEYYAVVSYVEDGLSDVYGPFLTAKDTEIHIRELMEGNGAVDITDGLEKPTN